RPALQSPKQGIEPARVGRRIVVQGGDVRRVRSGHALIDGSAEAGIGGILDDSRSRRRSVPPHKSLPAVVYYDHFKVAPRLNRKVLKALVEPRIRSQSGDHDRYQEIGQTSILT